MYNQLFRNRAEAGMLLADRLRKYKNSEAIILAIPRGGVAIGYEIAKTLNLPLDLALSKKIGHPSNKEYAIGSVSLDSAIISESNNVPKKYIHDEIIRIRKDLKEKYTLFMGTRQPIDLKNKTVIVVDDGIATGHTLLATIDMLVKTNPDKIIVAVPVVPYSTVEEIKKATDEFIYLMAPHYFTGVGAFYENFEQVNDIEVIKMLREINSQKLKL